jgi:hypothetical protein
LLYDLKAGLKAGLQGGLRPPSGRQRHGGHWRLIRSASVTNVRIPTDAIDPDPADG